MNVIGLIHRGRVQLVEALPAAAKRGIDQNIEPPKTLPGGRDGFLDRAFVAHVELQPKHPIVGGSRPQRSDGRCDTTSVTTGDHHCRTLFREGLGDGKTQITGASGDQGYFSRKVEHGLAAQELVGRENAMRAPSSVGRWPARGECVTGSCWSGSNTSA